MRKLFVLVMLVLLVSCQNSQESVDSVEISFDKGIFLPDLVSLEGTKEVSCTFDKANGLIYFARSDQNINGGKTGIYSMTYRDGWSEPELLIYTEDSKNFNPTVTRDGKYIFFYRLYESDKKSGTYYVEKNLDGYSQPQLLIDAYCVTSADFETFYASPIKGQHKDDIVTFTYKEGVFSDFHSLDFNTDAMETHPYISPNGDFILFDGIRDGIKGTYISYLDNDEWAKPVYLGDISYPSTDGQHIFYNNQEDIYVKGIEDLIAAYQSSFFYNQDLPYKEAKVFSEGLISLNGYSHYPASFSPNGDLMFYGQMDEERNRYLLYVKRDQLWSEPERISFTEGDEMEPFVSRDGKRVYFSSSTDSANAKPSNLYYVDYEEGVFSEPIRLPETINSNHIEYYLTESDNGNLYFTRENKGIYMSEFSDGAYLEAVHIDFPGYSYASHPCISRDESFLLFDARKSGNQGSADIYISFKTEEGFSEPINLGESVNTPDWDAMAMLSPQEDYLFFVREGDSRRDIYWIELNIEDYR
ncbi:hypothetical protein EZV73_18625 [Acidaminobacter sp. JC074]|uniref:hypothetical protein n=1 Tax=Acidaminobacter sp. JC074 TaxID=2530199 RepID=UPI001F10C48B|nr:hypothetical protein [Acidaminobacter sp. JC074]MCH4889604.1 hypothetical protein [Acidaminobacter sp. JC074]